MKEETLTILNALLEQNVRRAAANGFALSYSPTVMVLAKRTNTDTGLGEVLLIGLGGHGVGMMWVAEEPKHKDYPGYSDALIVRAP